MLNALLNLYVFNGKRSILLIIFAIFCLLLMQGIWLFYAVEQEKRFLETNTREAAIETIAALEQKEDSKILLTHLDTLLHHDIQKEIRDITVDPKERTAVKNARVYISNGNRKIQIERNDEEVIRTVSSVSGPQGRTEIQISRNNTRGNAMEKEKNRLQDYEHLLKKIVIQSKVPLLIQERINFSELQQMLYKSFLQRGIDMQPEFAISDRQEKILFKSSGFVKENNIILPIFNKDVIPQGNKLHVVHPSTISFILKRALIVILSSIFITVLLSVVMVLLYNKMQSEKKLHQYKNDFINNLTHELKTPLATIALANSNIKSDSGITEAVQLYTNIIAEENKKLNDHIEKVLGLSQLEKQEHIFELHTIDAHQFLKECVDQNKTFLDSRQVRLSLNFRAERVLLRADTFHLSNAISNLLDNAVKYSKQNTTIELLTKNDGDTILISVKDSGIGISKEHQHFIFDKFFRVTQQNLHETKGFGIGLSYSKQIIESFGGNIKVESELNKGSTFTITLPNAKT